MFRRQAARAAEEPIPDELIANIPVVPTDPNAGTTTFAVEAEEVIVTPKAHDSHARAPEDPGTTDAQTAPVVPSPIVQQWRYDIGEALARELDRGEAALAVAIGELEHRLAEAEAALARAHEAAEREREARERAEARLKAFKELALK